MHNGKRSIAASKATDSKKTTSSMEDRVKRIREELTKNTRTSNSAGEAARSTVQLPIKDWKKIVFNPIKGKETHFSGGVVVVNGKDELPVRLSFHGPHYLYKEPGIFQAASPSSQAPLPSTGRGRSAAGRGKAPGLSVLPKVQAPPKYTSFIPLSDSNERDVNIMQFLHDLTGYLKDLLREDAIWAEMEAPVPNEAWFDNPINFQTPLRYNKDLNCMEISVGFTSNTWSKKPNYTLVDKRGHNFRSEGRTFTNINTVKAGMGLSGTFVVSSYYIRPLEQNGPRAGYSLEWVAAQVFDETEEAREMLEDIMTDKLGTFSDEEGEEEEGEAQAEREVEEEEEEVEKEKEKEPEVEAPPPKKPPRGGRNGGRNNKNKKDKGKKLNVKDFIDDEAKEVPEGEEEN